MKKQQRNNFLFLKKVLRENLFKYSLFVSFRIQHEANKQNNNKNNEKNMEKSTEKKLTFRGNYFSVFIQSFDILALFGLSLVGTTSTITW